MKKSNFRKPTHLKRWLIISLTALLVVGTGIATWVSLVGMHSDEPIPVTDLAATYKGEVKDQEGNLLVPFDVAYPEVFQSGDVEYSDNTLLLKMEKGYRGKLTRNLQKCGIEKMEKFISLDSGDWYRAILSGEFDIATAIGKTRSLDEVEIADYDYIIRTADINLDNPDVSGEGKDQDPDDGNNGGGNDKNNNGNNGNNEDPFECIDDVKGNGKWKEQWYLGGDHMQKAWKFLQASGVPAGGLSTIVVAVIDTGVDYTHPDLAANMWVNTGEIPGNGIDDDDNGYVDDIHGASTIGSTYDHTGDPMDDHAHGTHVAGIIAASNNKEGIVGVAYNAKIMAVKAGQNSGIFLQSDIAEAILYAYENGADVINMSFGGSACSIAVQDALSTAYTRATLVAAAGNDGKPNQWADYYQRWGEYLPNYPAALSYVIGVMSVNKQGVESGFTNWDTVGFNTVEYEMYAPGEGIVSTLPGGKYGTLSGTSMAAPIVSGAAALLRSYFADRDMYPSKFIAAQLCATSGDTAICCDPKRHTVNGLPHNLPMILNISDALTKLPKPDVNLYDYYLYDSTVHEGNNGDGVIDAGEIVDIAAVLRNRWGMSKNTVVTIDVTNDHGVVNPYVELITDSVNFDGVGTYSTKSTLIYDEDNIITGCENPLTVRIKDNCPNDYLIVLDVTITFENGLDEDDKTVYTTESTVEFWVRNGVILPSQITEDMTLTKDNYYIIPNSTYIRPGVTVTVEPGTQIQFWSDDPNDPYAPTYIAMLNVEGSFITKGTAQEPVKLFPSQMMDRYRVEINEVGEGTVELNYTTVTNPVIDVTTIDHCTFNQTYVMDLFYRSLSNGVVSDDRGGNPRIDADRITNSLFYKLGSPSAPGSYSSRVYVRGAFDTCAFVDSAIYLRAHNYNEQNSFVNCVFAGNHATHESGSTYPSGSSEYLRSQEFFEISSIKRDNNTGVSTVRLFNYIDYYEGALSIQAAEDLAERMGGELVSIEGNKPYEYCYITIEIQGSIYCDTILLDEYAVSIDTESSYRLRPSVIPATFDTKELIYVSEDPTVATVDKSGLVTPLREGKTRVFVYSPDYLVNTYAEISVVPKVTLTGLRLDATEGTLAVGDKITLNPVLVPENTTERGLTFVSSDPAVAEVNENGVVTAQSVGKATITVTGANGLTVAYNVKVVANAERIDFAEIFYVTHVGDTADDWRPTVTPANATDVSISYASSNPEIAYVDENGELIRVSEGNATIRATLEGTDLYDEVVVSVTTADTLMDTKIKKMAQLQHITYALTEDGTLYLWGTNHLLPTKVCDGVKDFTPPTTGDYSDSVDETCYRNMYVLYEDGRLTRNNVYTKRNGLPCAELDLLEVSSIANAVAVEAEGDRYCGYALCDDGAVWAWGNNGHGQLGDGTQNDAAFTAPVQMEIMNVSKIIATYLAAGLLTENGDLYIVGTGNYYFTPHKLDSNVIDVVNPDSGIFMYRRADGIQMRVTTGGSRTDFLSLTHPAYGYGSFSSVSGYVTMEDGVVYLEHGSSYPVPGLTNVEYVYELENSVYMVTEDGKLYAFGENSHHELANLGIEDTTYEHPNCIFFGITADEGEVKLRDSNVITEIIKPDDSDESEDFGLAKENYLVPQDQWVISGHCTQIVGKEGHFNSPMVAAGGVESAALLHQGSIYLGNIDLSKYSKVVIYWGSDNGSGTQDLYKKNANNRFALVSADKDGTMSPAEETIIAAATYELHGWEVAPFEIDLTNVSYSGEVYLTHDSLPGGFALVSSIEFIGGGDGIKVTNTLTDRELSLNFDRALLKGANFGKITLTNSKGSNLSLKKDIFLDRFTLSPIVGFVHGESYTLHIPASALTDVFGNNIEPLRIQFTYSDPTPIQLIGSSLSDGVVQSSQDFTATFDFTLANKGKNFGQIAILKDGVAVDGVAVTLDKDVLTLSGTLDFGKYTLSIPEGALCDNVGGVNPAMSYSFSVIQTLKLESASVQNGDRYVSPTDAITLTFTNAQMGEAFGDVTLTAADGTAVAITKLLKDNVLTISHKGLAGDTVYTLSIPAGALVDEVGTANTAIDLRFTTYAPVTLLYGSVSGHNAVALDPYISLTYNGFAAVNGDLITLTDENGNAVALQVLTAEGNDTLLGLKPTAALSPDTTYTLTLGEGALVDLNGALSSAESFTFKTVKQTERYFLSEEDVKAAMDAWIEAGENNPGFHNNAILNNFNDTNVEHWLRMTAGEYQSGSEYVPSIGISGNWWGTTNKELIERQILDFDDYNTLADINVGSYLTTPPENTFPFVSMVYLLNQDGERVQVVSNETVTFVVEFNRDMDTSIPLTVRFGSSQPYGEYEIPGEYVTPRRWEGTYTLKTTIENGRQFFSISNGCAADDPYLILCESPARWGFEIDTSSAQAMIMQGEATEAGINLNWAQDDYDTLLGYNVYRSDKEDGLYIRLNDHVLSMEETTFFDDTVEPGKLYYYNFTVVLTDLSESTPSGKITIMSMDTMAPNVYHSPVRTAYTNSALMIAATVTDNMNLRTVTLYYRTTGESQWKSTEMTAVNSRYTGKIPAEHLSTDGLEYYISATDGISETRKGSADAPYAVTVQLAVDATALGDVDGDGRITNKDALMLMQAANDLLNLTEGQFMRADINGDGELSAAEALRILQYVSGKVTTIVG